MADTQTFIVIDRSKTNTPYRVSIEAKTSGEAIKYFFALEEINEVPVMPKYQNLEDMYDARYAVLNHRTGRITHYNADGEAFNMRNKTLYRVKRAHKKTLPRRAK